MTPLRIATLIAALTLSVAACNRETPPSEPDYEMNALLELVPADTPYLAANLAPLPDEFIDAWLVRLQPVLEEMQAQLTDARGDLEQEATTSTGAGDAAANPPRGLALALLRELDGKLDRAGLESLGLDVGGHKVAYGVGAFPVFRIGLKDPNALRATVERIFDDAGIAAPEETFQGVSYWRLAAEDRGDVPFGLYLAILDDHLAAGVLPPSAESEFLAAFLGVQKPAATDAADRLLDLNQAHGYTPYGSAILDLHRLADQILQPESFTAGVLADHEIIDKAPRMTAGTTELSPAAIGYQYRLESPPDLATRLMGLVAEIPAVDAASARMLEVAFGMRFGAVRDFVQEAAEAVVADPFACEQLQDLNEGAADMLARLEQPMPPFVNNFRGIRLSLDDIRMDGGTMPADARGHLAVHVEQPEMFVGMAQMFLPDLSNLALTAGDPPVRVPETLLPAPGMVAFAAITDDAIGLSVGDGEEAGLPAFLDREAGPEGTFLSASYDTGGYLDFTSRYAAERQADAAEAADEPAEDAVNAIADAASAAFRATAERSSTTMRFGKDGLVIDGRMTFR